MANSTKKSRSGKKSKAKVALGFVIAVMVLFVAGYFVYFSGIIPQLLPGMTITETKDGATVKIKDLSVLETNYYFMNIYSMYSQYGMITSDSLDSVFNSTTGQTYREYLLSQGAEEALANVLMEREADAKGFRSMSAADKAAKDELESLRGMSQLYGYPTLDRYIAAQYGTGMTSRLYRQCMARGLYADEYQQYISQFDPSIVPTDDSIREAYKADPAAYDNVDFNYYLVTAATKDGKTDIEQAKKDAQWISDKAKDAKSFRDAVMTYLKGKGDTEALKEYDNDADPTSVTDLTKANVEQQYDANLAAFLFADGRKAGDKTVVETKTGAYVVILNGRKLDEDKEVSYRTLTLNNDSKGKERTDDQIAADAKALADKAAQLAPAGMSSLDFYKLVKANSNDKDEMMDGGFVAGETKADMTEAEDGKEVDAQTKAVADWLFDESRKAGDIYIKTSADNRTVTIYFYEKSSPAWMGEARNAKITENVNKLKESLKATNPQFVVNSDLVKNFIYGA